MYYESCILRVLPKFENMDAYVNPASIPKEIANPVFCQNIEFQEKINIDKPLPPPPICQSEEGWRMLGMWEPGKPIDVITEKKGYGAAQGGRGVILIDAPYTPVKIEALIRLWKIIKNILAREWETQIARNSIVYH